MNLYHEWRELVRREYSNYSSSHFQKDFWASLTVAAVALPLALAFGVASGADASAGLITAIIAGIVIGVLGGSSYQISGPTGAMSAILIVLASRYGLEAVWIASLLAGGMLILLGVFHLGRLVALIPAPVISGFTSGIALIIAIGQLDHVIGIEGPPAENVLAKVSYYLTHDLTLNPYALGIALLVIVVMILWPYIPHVKSIPGSLVGIVVATIVTAVFEIDVAGIGSIPRSIVLENRLEFSSIPWNLIGDLFVPAMSIAALGAIESLLCGAVAGNMTGSRLHSSVELVAQGIGNLMIPFFGGVPATAAIARTSVNVKSGGVTRLSSILHGMILLLTALLFAPLIESIPVAALGGVLMVVAWRMNEWNAVRFYVGKRLYHAIAAFIITLLATVLLDLTQAIIIGFGVSSLIFLSQISNIQISSQVVDVSRLSNDLAYAHPEQPVTVCYISGPLFFGGARKLIDFVEASHPANTIIIFSLRGVPLIDATGIEVLRELWHRQQKGGGKVLLSGLQPRVSHLLDKSGLLGEIGAQNIFWSADRAILSLDASQVVDMEPAPAGEGIDATLTIQPLADHAGQIL